MPTKRLGDRIKAKFYEHFDRDEGQAREPRVTYLKPDSPAERWVYSEEYVEVEGWGRSARKKRAAGLAERLKTDDVGHAG
jgi:hypothetical protein